MAAKARQPFAEFCDGFGIDPNSDDEELMAGMETAYQEHLAETGGDVHSTWDPDGSKRAAAAARIVTETKTRNEAEPVNDTGHAFMRETTRLQGTPIPEEWTPNTGDTTRPMEVGMEVRIFGMQVYRVVRTSPTSADLEGFGACYLFAQKSYRRTRSAEERGIDSDTYSVLDYVGRSGRTNRQGEEDMATAKVAGIPNKTAAKTANGKAPKASAAPKVAREKKEKKVRDCICGCGGQTGSAFVPGHDARFKGWLGKIAKGQGKPSDYMSSSLAQRLGPWTDKGEGKVPTKTYKDLLN